MSKTSKNDCNTSTFLIKWVTVKPGPCWPALLGGYQGDAKASRRCSSSSVCARVFSRMNMPGTPLEEMSGRYPGYMPTWLQLAFLDLKEQKAPLSAISGQMNSLLYLYAWTQPPCRRILVICICRFVILVPAYPQLPGPELILSAT